MANYTYLTLGDRLPTVGVAQKLLKAHGYIIDTDGIFRRDTREAVIDFQNEKHITADGIIGVHTWEKLVEHIRLPILDCVDITDIKSDEDELYEHEYNQLINTQSIPIAIGGTSDGTSSALSHILNRIEPSTFLLRFHGHGDNGVAGVSDGDGLGFIEREHTFFDVREIRRLRNLFERIGSSFSRYGSVQFMHCRTAGGRDGRYFINTMAEIMQVPVTGGVNDQFAGSVDTFRFEGETYTAIPNGGNVRLWCNTLPDFMQSV